MTLGDELIGRDCGPKFCECSGHFSPGVSHIVPCCNTPHVTTSVFDILRKQGVKSRTCNSCKGEGYLPLKSSDLGRHLGLYPCDQCRGTGTVVRQPLPS